MTDNERMLAGLLDASHGLTLEQMPRLVREQAAHAGLGNALIYLADLQGDVLRAVTGRGLDAGADACGHDAAELPIEGTLAGQSFTGLEPVHEAGRWWVPLLNGSERIGVLRIDSDQTPEQTAPLLQRLASLVTLLLLSVEPQSDSFARLTRRQPMTVAAELQWNLMPPRALINTQVTLSAALEPAYQVAGDAFDYALADHTVHLEIFDAMGHDVAAGLTANLAVAACRNARRQNLGLAATGAFVERVLIEQLGPEPYCTALLLDLDTTTGQLTWINHGHHPPVVIRDGAWSGLLSCPPAHPLGTDLGIEATLCREQLRPGDRLVLYTDGITEARDPRGEEFGLERFMDFIMTHNAEGLPIPETLRRLVRSVLDYQNGQLQDDATVVFMEWRGLDPASPDSGMP
ncbi:PP2C family protein-serine/threonine phosphatase [Streptomyces smyrnaeus]|uniref:PP2C family protein-serine/threonine phosphatase n=1 Tax=Streptomyces smyrnaeus TaxID=1387713 RepID=UPI00368965C1